MDQRIKYVGAGLWSRAKSGMDQRIKYVGAGLGNKAKSEWINGSIRGRRANNVQWSMWIFRTSSIYWIDIRLAYMAKVMTLCYVPSLLLFHMTFFVLINNALESQCLGSILNISTVNTRNRALGVRSRDQNWKEPELACYYTTQQIAWQKWIYVLLYTSW
jgi:hypothetical protein